MSSCRHPYLSIIHGGLSSCFLSLSLTVWFQGSAVSLSQNSCSFLQITCLSQLMSCHVDLPWNSLLVSRQIKNINPSARLLLSDQLSLYSISFDFSAAHWTHHSYGWLTIGYLTFWIQSSQIQGIIIMAIAKKVNVTSLYYYLFSVPLHPKKQILQQLV